MANFFTKSLQNVGSIVRSAGTGGFNAVQSRLASAGLFPGGIAGISRKPLGSNAGSPSSTGDWAVKLSLARQTYDELFASSPLSAGLTNSDNGMRFPTTPFINLQHTANYNQVSLMHNNYPYQAYQNSQVQQITISGDFLAENRTALWIFFLLRLNSIFDPRIKYEKCMKSKANSFQGL